MSVLRSACKDIVIFAILISAFNSQAHAIVYAPNSESSAHKAAPATVGDEPFGLSTSLLPEGPLRAKWQGVARAIETESKIIAECRINPETCGSPAALRFLDIVRTASARSGLARLGEVNRAFNLEIRPASDQAQYGTEDYWSSPLATLTAGAGDCEDYAIAKLVALHEAGVASTDLRLVIVRETVTGEDHALLAARVDGRWRLLDNRTFVMIEDADLGKQRPLFAIDTEGVKRFEQAPIATAQVRQDVSPASPAAVHMREAVPARTGIETGFVDSFALTLIM